MLFYCKYISHGQEAEQIFDVLDINDLYAHCHMFHLEVIDYHQISYTENNSDLYTHEKGGVYSLVGKANPAGDHAKEFGLIIVYKDVINNCMYYRHWSDFIEKLQVAGQDESSS